MGSLRYHSGLLGVSLGQKDASEFKIYLISYLRVCIFDYKKGFFKLKLEPTYQCIFKKNTGYHIAYDLFALFFGFFYFISFF